MKRFLLSITITLMFVGFAGAQDGRSLSGGTARNISMGGGPVNPFLIDAFRIHTNPALAGMYADYVWGDIGFANTDAGSGNANFGGGVDQYAAALFGMDKSFTLGLIVNKREGPLFTRDATDASRDPVSAVNGSPIVPAGFAFNRPLSPVEVLGSY